MKLSEEIEQSLRDLARSDKAQFLPRFFKTGKGEYGEGDKFLGVVVPDQRAVVKEYFKKVDLKDIQELLESPYHECRLTALLLLVSKYEKSKDDKEKRLFIDFYLKNLQHVNNWDLVDLSCYKLLGRYSFENEDDSLLMKLSKEEDMWKKRVAIVGTMYYVKKGKLDLTKKLVLNNLNHPHDLMHKANGWLLREMGKQNEQELFDFLKNHYQNMPRTTLRYAIEKLDESLRQDFLKGRI